MQWYFSAPLSWSSSFKKSMIKETALEIKIKATLTIQLMTLSECCMCWLVLVQVVFCYSEIGGNTSSNNKYSLINTPWTVWQQQNHFVINGLIRMHKKCICDWLCLISFPLHMTYPVLMKARGRLGCSCCAFWASSTAPAMIKITCINPGK